MDAPCVRDARQPPGLRPLGTCALSERALSFEKCADDIRGLGLALRPRTNVLFGDERVLMRPKHVLEPFRRLDEALACDPELAGCKLGCIPGALDPDPGGVELVVARLAVEPLESPRVRRTPPTTARRASGSLQGGRRRLRVFETIDQGEIAIFRQSRYGGRARLRLRRSRPSTRPRIAVPSHPGARPALARARRGRRDRGRGRGPNRASRARSAARRPTPDPRVAARPQESRARRVATRIWWRSPDRRRDAAGIVAITARAAPEARL